MKKVILFVFVLFVSSQYVKAHDFSAVAPSGQTLYYSFCGEGVEVVQPGNVSGNNWNGYQKPIGDLIIPDSVIYLGVSFPVNGIGNSAFIYCSDIISVSIPSTVTYISAGAFANCSGLVSINIPSSVLSIGRAAFSSCVNLTTIEIPESITCIEENTFLVSGLTSLILPNSIISIGRCAFAGCQFTSIIIPESVTTIGFQSFGSCSHLTSVSIPSSVISIDSLAFEYCANITYLFYNSNANIPNCIPHNSLHSVVIGDSVVSIPANAFTNTNSLTSVSIGSSVTTIGDNAFRFCTSLDTIKAFPSVAPTLGLNVFQGTPFNKNVFVPCGVDYSSVWGNAGFNYITNIFSLTLSSNNNGWGTVEIIQDVDCQQTAVIEALYSNGHRFVSWSDGNNDNPRVITLSHDSIITAIFDEYWVSLSVQCDDSIGEVFGGGTFLADTSVTIEATATCGYRFSRWNDGNNSNPRIIIITSDTSFFAYFERDRDTTFVFDTTFIEVHDTSYIDVPYLVHDTTIIHDTTYVDVPYPVHDTTIVHDTTYVDVPYPVHDTTIVTMTDTISIHDTTTVFQTDTLWLHDTVYLHDTIYIHDTIVVGMDEVDAINAKIYTSRGQIVVDGTEGNTVWLYDINGRVLATKQDEYTPLHFDVPTSGTYLVKIGNHSARKVVVIR